jgi:hypothetical protein
MRISAQFAVRPSCTVWLQCDDDERSIAQVDTDGAIIWAIAEQPCIGTRGDIGFGPCLRRRQPSDKIVVYLPEETSIVEDGT